MVKKKTKQNKKLILLDFGKMKKKRKKKKIFPKLQIWAMVGPIEQVFVVVVVVVVVFFNGLNNIGLYLMFK